MNRIEKIDIDTLTDVERKNGIAQRGVRLALSLSVVLPQRVCAQRELE